MRFESVLLLVSLLKIVCDRFLPSFVFIFVLIIVPRIVMFLSFWLATAMLFGWVLL